MNINRPISPQPPPADDPLMVQTFDDLHDIDTLLSDMGGVLDLMQEESRNVTKDVSRKETMEKLSELDAKCGKIHAMLDNLKNNVFIKLSTDQVFRVRERFHQAEEILGEKIKAMKALRSRWQLGSLGRQTLRGITQEHLAHGKAKNVSQPVADVIVEGVHQQVPVGEAVEIQPVSGLMSVAKKKEILDEVVTAEDIKEVLTATKEARDRDKIRRFCLAVGCNVHDSDVVTGNFPNLQTLVSALNAFAENPTKIPKGMDSLIAGKLLKFAELPKHKMIMAQLLDDDPHIAVDIKLEDRERKYSVENPVVQPKASRDLEGMMKSKDLSPQERALLSYQFVEGMRNLHQAGYVHGDLKAENALVFKRTINSVSITDFGKTKKLGPDGKLPYGGNPRYASTDMVLSQKAEVQTTAFTIIRILEEQFLDERGNPLVSSGSVEDMKKSEEKHKRRGFERFVTTNPLCPQLDMDIAGVPGQIKTFAERRQADFQLIQQPNAESLAAVREIHKYIDALTAAMSLSVKDEGKIAMIRNLSSLLKDMTNADPQLRPTLTKALDAFPIDLLSE